MGLCPSRNVERNRDSVRDDEEARENEVSQRTISAAPEASFPVTSSIGVTSVATPGEDDLQELPELTVMDEHSSSMTPSHATETTPGEPSTSLEVSIELPASTANDEDSLSDTEAFFSSQSQILVIVLPRRSATDRPRVVLVVFENGQNAASHEETQFQNLLNHLFQISQPKTHPTSVRVLKSLPESCMDEILLKKAPRCVICCEEFTIGQLVVRMPCDHVFEKACVEPWLKENNTCPVCRYELPVEDDEEYENQRRQRMKQSRGEIDESSFFGQMEESTATDDGKSEKPDL